LHFDILKSFFSHFVYFFFFCELKSFFVIFCFFVLGFVFGHKRPAPWRNHKANPRKMNNNNNNIDSSISSNLSDGGDEGYPSPDDDITKAGTEMRQRLREDRRLKRKRMEAAAAAVLNDGKLFFFI